jgi:hypothetical protein
VERRLTGEVLNIVEPERSIIRLTSREREEFARAEAEIGETIGAFLRCGRSLSLIRSKRLYREAYPTFDRYVAERWAISKAAAGTLLSSYHIAEQLEEAGIRLPHTVTQSSMRTLAGCAREEGLRAAVWQYAVSLSPEAGCPPLALLRRICGIIREALGSDGVWDCEGASPGDHDDVDGAGNRVLEECGPAEEPCGRPEGNKKRVRGDERFLRAIARLAGYHGFSVPLVVSQVESEKMAGYVWRSCERLKQRLEEVEEAIVRQFPSAQRQET